MLKMRNEDGEFDWCEYDDEIGSCDVSGDKSWNIDVNNDETDGEGLQWSSDSFNESIFSNQLTMMSACGLFTGVDWKLIKLGNGLEELLELAWWKKLEIAWNGLGLKNALPSFFL